VLLYFLHEAVGLRLRWVGAFTFACLLASLLLSEWGKKQLRMVRRRRHFDFAYAYGLDLAGVSISRDETNPTGGLLQLGLVLRNAADGPLKYEVEHLEVVVGDRTVPTAGKGGGFILRGGQRTWFYPPFKREAVQPRMRGLIRYTIRYGHPEIGFSRLAKGELALTIRFDEKTGVNWIVKSESDDDIP
jgi:hypothetical protein